MGILHDLHRHCEDILLRGYKTVSAEYVIDMIKRHESEYTTRTAFVESEMIDKSSNVMEGVKRAREADKEAWA